MWKLQYNTVKPNLKGPADLLCFRDTCSFGLKKATIKKNSGVDRVDISFGSPNRLV